MRRVEVVKGDSRGSLRRLTWGAAEERTRSATERTVFFGAEILRWRS